MLSTALTHLVYLCIQLDAREPPGVHRATELAGERPPPTRIESVRSPAEVGIVQDAFAPHPGELCHPRTDPVRPSPPVARCCSGRSAPGLSHRPVGGTAGV